jgi:hypothetical protein
MIPPLDEVLEGGRAAEGFEVAADASVAGGARGG